MKQCSAEKLVEGLGVFAEMHHINDMKVATVVACIVFYIFRICEAKMQKQQIDPLAP